MKDIFILAIETSCDETSISIVKNGKDELVTTTMSQIDIHAKYGGVVPEIASRNHELNITWAIEQTLQKIDFTIKDIDLIAVTYGPGLIGSLLVGIMAAKTLAFINQIPLIPVHHIASHIYASNLEKNLEFPLIALVVSGGHTELILMKRDYHFQKMGGTLDDAVGETYDKVGRILKLPYPGGPLVDQLAQKGIDNYQLPLPLDDNSYNFSFSGLKSAVTNLVHNEKQKNEQINQENLATSFQNRVVQILVKKTIRAMKECDVTNLVLAGGVAANQQLRKELEQACFDNNFTFFKPNIKYCTDNGAMVGAAAYYAYITDKYDKEKLIAKSTEEL